jgi:hypothetical protein
MSYVLGIYPDVLHESSNTLFRRENMHQIIPRMQQAVQSADLFHNNISYQRKAELLQSLEEGPVKFHLNILQEMNAIEAAYHADHSLHVTPLFHQQIVAFFRHITPANAVYFTQEYPNEWYKTLLQPFHYYKLQVTDANLHQIGSALQGLASVHTTLLEGVLLHGFRVRGNIRNPTGPRTSVMYDAQDWVDPVRLNAQWWAQFEQATETLRRDPCGYNVYPSLNLSCRELRHHFRDIVRVVADERAAHYFPRQIRDLIEETCGQVRQWESENGETMDADGLQAYRAAIAQSMQHSLGAVHPIARICDDASGINRSICHRIVSSV